MVAFFGRRPSAASQVTDLPQPDSPTSPTASPRSIERSMPCRTGTPSKATLRLEISTSGIMQSFWFIHSRGVKPPKDKQALSVRARCYNGSSPVVLADVHRVLSCRFPFQRLRLRGDSRVLVEVRIGWIFAFVDFLHPLERFLAFCVIRVCF